MFTVTHVSLILQISKITYYLSSKRVFIGSQYSLYYVLCSREKKNIEHYSLLKEHIFFVGLIPFAKKKNL